MKTLGIDIETFSPVDLPKAGVYAYAGHPDFEILLFAYSADNGPVQIVDIASGEQVPDDILSALEDPGVLKTAFNANFEITCINRFKGLPVIVHAEQWECTMVKGAMLGLPLSLAQVADVLKLENRKMTEGKKLIRFFSMPCAPTYANRRRTRNLPTTDPEKWELFKKYCICDVEVEQAIREKLEFYKVPEFEKKLWIVDQRINDRGIMIDLPFVNAAIEMDEITREKLEREAVKFTGLNNPNSTTQLKEWVSSETGTEVDTLTKTTIPEIMKATDCDKVTRVLEIRQKMAKTSVKKYNSMLAAVGFENRIRGLFQFYGANRTGRWAGRMVQVQNLPKNKLRDLDTARLCVKSGDLDLTEMLYGNVPDTLSQLIRTAFIAREGDTFIVADFSAIEARVIAWLAGEKWRLDVFENNGDIYCASAAQMFRVPVEKNGVNGHLRQKGKIAELALGYGGSVGALDKMGAVRMGIDKKELPELVSQWRASNPKIVNLWDSVDTAAKETVIHGQPRQIARGVSFELVKGVLFVQLPSGRRLSYLKARLGENRFGGSSLVYEGMDQTTKKWKTLETYGGKLVENIIQAIARDCLAEAMVRVEDALYRTVMHVHDELVIETKKETAEKNLERVCRIMGEPIPWAEGLILNADGYITDYYKKD